MCRYYYTVGFSSQIFRVTYIFTTQKHRKQYLVIILLCRARASEKKFCLRGQPIAVSEVHNILKVNCGFVQILLLMLDFHHIFFVLLIILVSCLKFYNTKIQKNNTWSLFRRTGRELLNRRLVWGINQFFLVRLFYSWKSTGTLVMEFYLVRYPSLLWIKTRHWYVAWA